MISSLMLTFPKAHLCYSHVVGHWDSVTLCRIKIPAFMPGGQLTWPLGAKCGVEIEPGAIDLHGILSPEAHSVQGAGNVNENK